jgi:hypothetical protein
VNISSPALHAFALKTAAHQAAAAAKLKVIMDTRAKALAPAPQAASTAPSIAIPLLTVSLEHNFDALVKIKFAGAPDTPAVCNWDDVGLESNPSPCLIVDSGNSTLIVPDFNSIKTLPSFDQNYKVLADDSDLTEPFGCPAVILRGPIQIPAPGGYHEIKDCVFYACTGPKKDATDDQKKQRTANFGLGWISPWAYSGSPKVPPVQSPLTYNAAYPYAEVKFAGVDKTLTAASSDPKVAEGSFLVVHKRDAVLPNYRMFEITRGLAWMSLIPRFLAIGDVQTVWPGPTPPPLIAMIDTGGGPVFLSDPRGLIYTTKWPNNVPLPDWTSQSFLCQAVNDDLTIAIGDRDDTYHYQIDPSRLPADDQGLTLVMCNTCSFMEDNQGMNTGGLSALFNDILIDYASGRVGFSPKVQVTT